MTVRPSATATPASKVRATPPGLGQAGKPPAESPFQKDVVARLSGSAAKFVASAPGRINVMGGIAEYSGGLVLNVTTGEHVCVGVQRREDERVTISISSSSSKASDPVVSLSLASLLSQSGKPVSATKGLELLGTGTSVSVRTALGAVIELLRCGVSFDADQEGLSISIGSGLDDWTDVGNSAAIAAATLTATAAAIGAEMPPHQLAELCQRVENDWLAAPVGIGDASIALFGEPGSLARICCDQWSVSNEAWLPSDVVLIGIDCGVAHDGDFCKYRRVRAATFMGQALIGRILQHDAKGLQDWDGHLSRFCETDFARRFRDRIPTKITGQEFLERFGETNDPLTQIEPSATYKIRSRTEHHIYEHSRAVQFAACFSQPTRKSDAGRFKEAGELMYGSHWSYGQRCGLGSIETDKLISLIRRQDAGDDIFGAKITGRGCGGVVAVLMRKTDRARQALGQATSAYQEETGNTCKELCGSYPGAVVGGVRQVSDS